MSAEPIESLANKIMDRYNQQPVGWTVLTDFKGNVLVLGPEEGYMLKMVTINPQEHTGVGVKLASLHEMRNLVEGAPPYGFRPLSRVQAAELQNSFCHSEKQNRLVSEILERDPLPMWELEKQRPNAVLSGPMIAHPDLSTISKSQKELEAKLTIEAQKLFREKYPHRAAIYR
ncbi:MAG: hypothetical protein V1850_00025 [Candidatus Bathyarchaeota archaeon]